MFDFTGKRVLITGSTQGIGLAMAKGFSAAGATVYINGATGMEKITQAMQQVPGSRPALCDLARPDCAEVLYDATGEVDILILNASVQIRKAWDQITPEEMERQIAVNFKSGVLLIEKYAPAMVKKGWGRIVTVGSVQQAKPHKDMLIYAAMKSATENMVRNLAKQLAPFGVTVNNIAPGVIYTPRNSDALADAGYAQKVMEGIPAGYYGEAEDCSGTALLLCSEQGRYMTGENIFIDGGMKL